MAVLVAGAPNSAPLPISPTLEGIRSARVFGEPLLPLGAKLGTGENARLVEAIEAFRAQHNSEALEPFFEFLKVYPNSPWRASLLLNIGKVYWRTGHFTKALEVLEEGWNLAKSSTDPQMRLLADGGWADLADLTGRLGRVDRLDQLLKEVEGRGLKGSAGERHTVAEEALWQMRNQPNRSFRCGPLGLAMIQKATGGTGADLEKEDSTAHGTSLSHNAQLARKYGFKLQMAKREPGSPMPLPTLVHWKAGHFAALIKEVDGRYLLQDPTFGNEVWVSRMALDEEASGYALIPQGSLPKGWRSVTDAEGNTVWGKGVGGDGNTDNNSPDDHETKPDCKNNKGMPGYSYHTSLVSLSLKDIPVGYTPPRGPAVPFQITYSQRESHQPQVFGYSNLGPKWTFEFLSYIEDNPTIAPDANGGYSMNVRDYLRGGGGRTHVFTGSAISAPEFRNRSLLVRTGPSSYERRIPDGSVEVYGVTDGALTYPRRVFLTKIIDPAGNALSIGFDAQLRITTLTDALGQVTALSYELASDTKKITKVTDPFGRSATFQYNTAGQLSAVTDVLGLTSSFEYGPTAASPGAAVDFIHAMNTPYGTTTFVTGNSGSNRWIETTDPMGGTERIEYLEPANGTFNEAVFPFGWANMYLTYRNTFFWDKRAFAQFPGDYTKAQITHWLHGSGGHSGIMESEKSPLSSRIWYGYPGQADGTGHFREGSSGLVSKTIQFIGPISQATSYERNPEGKTTKVIDPVGRTTTFTYAPNGLDLLEVWSLWNGQSDLLAKYTYNAQHRPLTSTDTAGQSTTFTYNGWGQVLTITNPKGETTTLSYDPVGYLKEVQGAVAGATTSFTYDTNGRIQTVSGADGATTAFEYDALDRPTKTFYSDGTDEVKAYDRLELAATRDRKGQWTYLQHNALRQLVEVQDPLGRVTRLDWCGCGQLEGLTDPLGRVTSWIRDLQGRVVSKMMPDRTETLYDYDEIGRLARRTDAMGQITNYEYTLDGNLRRVGYLNAVNPTPTVNYSYDARYNRLATMVDGLGTTTYNYHPITSTPTFGAGRLATVKSPMAQSTISYGYDALGRVITRGINGVAETRGFDALGRLVTVSSPLGAFSYAYEGLTNRLQNVAYPNGQTTAFSYFDQAGANRLKDIKNLKSDATPISAFSYTYDANGQIQTWSQQADVAAPKVYTFQYDAANQLTGALLSDGNGQTLRNYVYAYDASGNRVSEQIDGAITSATFNNLNQLVDQRFDANASLLAARAAEAMKAQVSSSKKRAVSPKPRKSRSAFRTQKPAVH